MNAIEVSNVFTANSNLCVKAGIPYASVLVVMESRDPESPSRYTEVTDLVLCIHSDGTVRLVVK